MRRNKFCPPGLPLPYLKKPPRRNRDAYRREVLGLPGPVDRWLTANSACGTTNLLCTLLMNNEVEDFVICTVRRVRIEATPNDTIFGDPDTHILYITASATNESIPIFHRTSPTAILDHFVGNTRDIAAPEWMAWDRVELQFRQPRSSIADIFARLAVSDHNSLERGLSFRMIEWAKNISVRTWSDSSTFGPLTPSKPSVACNTKCRKRRVPTYRESEESPCKGKVYRRNT